MKGKLVWVPKYAHARGEEKKHCTLHKTGEKLGEKNYTQLHGIRFRNLKKKYSNSHELCALGKSSGVPWAIVVVPTAAVVVVVVMVEAQNHLVAYKVRGRISFPRTGQVSPALPSRGGGVHQPQPKSTRNQVK